MGIPCGSEGRPVGRPVLWLDPNPREEGLGNRRARGEVLRGEVGLDRPGEAHRLRIDQLEPVGAAVPMERDGPVAHGGMRRLDQGPAVGRIVQTARKPNAAGSRKSITAAIGRNAKIPLGNVVPKGAGNKLPDTVRRHGNSPL